jgi:hypothetical protein
MSAGDRWRGRLLLDSLLRCCLDASVVVTVVTDASVKVKVKVTLWLTVSQSVSLGVKPQIGGGIPPRLHAGYCLGSDASMSDVRVFILLSLGGALTNGRRRCRGERWLGSALFTVGDSHSFITESTNYFGYSLIIRSFIMFLISLLKSFWFWHMTFARLTLFTWCGWLDLKCR